MLRPPVASPVPSASRPLTVTLARLSIDDDGPPSAVPTNDPPMTPERARVRSAELNGLASPALRAKAGELGGKFTKHPAAARDLMAPF